MNKAHDALGIDWNTTFYNPKNVFHNMICLLVWYTCWVLMCLGSDTIMSPNHSRALNGLKGATTLAAGALILYS